MSGRGKLNFKGDKKRSKKVTTSKKENDTISSKESWIETIDGQRNHVREPSSGAKVDDTINSETDVAFREKAVKRHNNDEEDDLTPAEKKARKFKAKHERRQLEKIVQLSHRERVEKFNEHLGQLTELNDIPRISAAGNG